MRCRLYQVQLEEPDCTTHCFEIATNNDDAADLARAFLSLQGIDYPLASLHLGGYDEIGHCYKRGVHRYKRHYYDPNLKKRI